MPYSDYGLDDVKKTHEAGKQSRSFFCPWTQTRYTGKNFYLCFADWIISQPAIEAFLQQEPDTADLDDRCQKCNQPEPLLHYTVQDYEFETGMKLGICPNCVAAAAHYILEKKV